MASFIGALKDDCTKSKVLWVLLWSNTLGMVHSKHNLVVYLQNVSASLFEAVQSINRSSFQVYNYSQ